MLPFRPPRLKAPFSLPASIGTIASCRSFTLSCCQRERPATALKTRIAPTTTSTHSTDPELPGYVYYPESIQPEPLQKVKVKGYLPTPRLVVSPNTTKLSRQFFLRTIPHPASTEARSARPQFQQDLAKQRRKALKTGLEALIARQTARRLDDVRAASRSRFKRLKALNAPIPADQLLTTVSQPLAHSSHFQHGPLPVGNPELHLARAKDNLQKTREARAAVQKRALLKLYKSAVTANEEFIVSADHLDAVIERVFVRNPAEWSQSKLSANIWHTGAPYGVAARLEDAFTARDKSDVLSGYNSDAGGGVEGEERVKQIAEELLGLPLRDTPAKKGAL